MDEGVWQAVAYGITQSDMTKRLRTYAHGKIRHDSNYSSLDLEDLVSKNNSRRVFT